MLKASSFSYISACAGLTVVANLLLRHGLIKSGGLAFKQGEWMAGWINTLSQPTFIAGILCYGLAAVVWFYALSVTEVSVGYPVLVGLTFVLVTLGAFFVFKEELNPAKIAGILVILIGVAMVARGS